MILNKLDNYFIQDPTRMRMGKGKLSKRFNCTEEDVVKSRIKARKIITAVRSIPTLVKAEELARPVKKLYFDIEVSPNLVMTWGVGRNLFISPDSIIQERAIICVCWKWEGSDKVHELHWDKGCDKKLLFNLVQVLHNADEVITQNGDSFDIKWVRARALFHGIKMPIKFNSIDTLKMARAGFRFNSNKLDYMGQFLGLGKKISASYDLWRNITLSNCQKSMNEMITYCKQDVLLLEKVYKKLKDFAPEKKFKYKK